MSDNTKIKERLRFSSFFSCIVSSTLSTESTKISLLKFPLYVIAIIANQEKEIATSIFELHRKLLDIAAQLQLKILRFGADSTSAEFNAQNQLMHIEISERLVFKDTLY
ncbi:2763_t:CDS:2, partial [Scutellospora calospora]